MNDIVPRFMMLSRAGDTLLKERGAVEHTYVPPGQPSEWPIPISEFLLNMPEGISKDAPYTTNSQNVGGKS
jgi:hypothetical protein